MLYIPLCLYFNEEHQSDLLPILPLYIPLCLYFNPDPMSQRRYVQYFTFHYVSILIQTESLQFLHNFFFTFHYVSILIGRSCARSTWIFSFTFHYVSILINCILLCVEPCFHLYIPLCLYFNQCTHPESSRRFFFTFHYVSILIRNLSRIK